MSTFRNAQQRNWFKLRLLGVSAVTYQNDHIATGKEREQLQIIDNAIKNIIDNWEDSNLELGFKAKKHEKGDNKERI